MAIGDQPRQRLRAAAGNLGAAGQHQSAPPSLRLEALPAVTVPSFLKAARKRGQALGGGICAHMLIGVENHRALAGRQFDRNDLLLEIPGGDRRRRPPMGFDRERILLLSREIS